MSSTLARPPFRLIHDGQLCTGGAAFGVEACLQLARLLAGVGFTLAGQLLAQSGDSFSELRRHGQSDAQRVVERLAYAVSLIGHESIPSIPYRCRHDRVTCRTWTACAM
jgi:hypothetical protein